MAVWGMDDYRATDAGRGGRGGAQKVVRLGGAGLSVALVAGLALWGYRLAERQMNGIPVIHAPAGPARVAPDNPGGELALHQGLAVNAIAAEGSAAGAADQLTLAPHPAELAADDVATPQLEVSGGSTLAPLPGPEAAPNRAVVPGETAAALKPAPGQLSEPLPDSAVDPVDDPEAGGFSTDAAVAAALGIEPPAAPAPEGVLAADVPGLTTSVIPPVRPSGDLIAAAAADAVASAQSPAGGAVDVDPASLTSGTVLAQIGSYETAAIAKLEWDKAVARFGALMDGKGRVIQEAASGGRSFFRLRVSGFDSTDDARRFCAAFRSGGQCVPALVR